MIATTLSKISTSFRQLRLAPGTCRPGLLRIYAIALGFLLSMGCGTKDGKEKEEPQTETEDDSGQTTASVEKPTNKSSSSFNPKGVEEQLKERGWGCSISLPRPISMTWRFTKVFPEERGVRRNRDEFFIGFYRNSKEDPWDFTKPQVVKPPYSGTPEMKSLLAEVVDEMHRGPSYIAAKYDCYVCCPSSLDMSQAPKLR